MTEVEMYRGDVAAPLYVDLGDGFIKVYFNEAAETVERQSMEKEGKIEKVKEYTAWHADVKPEYGHIIAGIVRTKYSQDDVEAILCNHVEGREDGDYENLVAWRQMAHDVAKKVMEDLKK